MLWPSADPLLVNICSCRVVMFFVFVKLFVPPCPTPATTRDPLAAAVKVIDVFPGDALAWIS